MSRPSPSCAASTSAWWGGWSGSGRWMWWPASSVASCAPAAPCPAPATPSRWPTPWIRSGGQAAFWPASGLADRQA
eukprot:scaffold14801_cov105-Isochrysis_galbana.AAC.7